MSTQIDELIDDLRHKRFQIDCLQMQLKNKKTGKEYAGPGYIRQGDDHDHGFRIRIWHSGKLYLTFEHLDPKRIGTLFGEDDFFDLEATDAEGRTWTAKRIVIPHVGGLVGSDPSIVEADSHLISLRQDLCYCGESNSIRIKCFDSIDFPRNMKEFESNGMKFRFSDDNGFAAIAEAEDESRLPAEVDERVGGRITEAIMFALGVVPRWVCIGRSGKVCTITRFRNPNEKETRPIQTPPYKFRLFDAAATIKMFDRYLAYILGDTKTPLHPLSHSVFVINNTRTSSVQGQGLAVAVAVESVVEKFYQKAGVAESCAEVNDFLAHIETWKGNKRLIERSRSDILKLAKVRIGDRLRDLESHMVIGKGDRQKWTKLRNTGAHGDELDDFQELIDLTHVVNVLFNRLIYNLIGYTGSYTNYGIYGWPEQEYPNNWAPEPKRKIKPWRWNTTFHQPDKRNRFTSAAQWKRMKTQKRLHKCVSWNVEIMNH